MVQKPKSNFEKSNSVKDFHGVNLQIPIQQYSSRDFSHAQKANMQSVQDRFLTQEKKVPAQIQNMQLPFKVGDTSFFQEHQPLKNHQYFFQFRMKGHFLDTPKAMSSQTRLSTEMENYIPYNDDGYLVKWGQTEKIQTGNKNSDRRRNSHRKNYQSSAFQADAVPQTHHTGKLTLPCLKQKKLELLQAKPFNDKKDIKLQSEKEKNIDFSSDEQAPRYEQAYDYLIKRSNSSRHGEKIIQDINLSEREKVNENQSLLTQQEHYLEKIKKQQLSYKLSFGLPHNATQTQSHGYFSRHDFADSKSNNFMSVMLLHKATDLKKQKQNLLRQIVVNCMQKSFKISEETAINVLRECKNQINNFRKDETFKLTPQPEISSVITTANGQEINRIFIDSEKSSEFFQMVLKKIKKTYTNNSNSFTELNSILNLILICLQAYQSQITKESALGCFEGLLDCYMLKGLIFNWINYSNIGLKTTNQTQYDTENQQKVKGFLQTCVILMDDLNGQIVWNVLVKVFYDRLEELILTLLPNTLKCEEDKTEFYLDTIHFLKQALNNFDRQIMSQISVMAKFEESNILERIVIQSCDFIEINTKIIEAVQLLFELWFHFPNKFVEIYLNDASEMGNSLANKVLQAVKRTALKFNNLSLRIQISTNLFHLFCSIQPENKQTGDLIYKILVLFLVEWHEDQTLRSHMIQNFQNILGGPGANISQLVLPLCNIIKINLGSDVEFSSRYLLSEDFKFFQVIMYDLVSQTKLNIQSSTQCIIALCQVLELYMLKKNCQYRNIAHQIFTSLLHIDNFDFALLQQYLKDHIQKAIKELEDAENEVSLNTSIAAETEIELQIQIQYLYRHIILLVLANLKSFGIDNTLIDYAIQTIQSQIGQSLTQNKFLNGLLSKLSKMIKKINTEKEDVKLEELKLTPSQTLESEDSLSITTRPVSQIANQVSPISNQVSQYDQSQLITEKLLQLRRKSQSLIKRKKQDEHDNIDIIEHVNKEERQQDKNENKSHKSNQGIKDSDKLLQSINVSSKIETSKQDLSNYVKDASKKQESDLIIQRLQEDQAQLIQDCQGSVKDIKLSEQINVVEQTEKNNFVQEKKPENIIESEKISDEDRIRDGLNKMHFGAITPLRYELSQLPIYQEQQFFSPSISQDGITEANQNQTSPLLSNFNEYAFSPSVLSNSITPIKVENQNGPSQLFQGLKLYRMGTQTSLKDIVKPIETTDLLKSDSNSEQNQDEHNIIKNLFTENHQNGEPQKNQQSKPFQITSAIIQVSMPASNQTQDQDEKLIKFQTLNQLSETRADENKPSLIQSNLLNSFGQEKIINEPDQAKVSQLVLSKQNQQETVQNRLPTTIHSQNKINPAQKEVQKPIIQPTRYEQQLDEDSNNQYNTVPDAIQQIKICQKCIACHKNDSSQSDRYQTPKISSEQDKTSRLNKINFEHDYKLQIKELHPQKPSEERHNRLKSNLLKQQKEFSDSGRLQPTQVSQSKIKQLNKSLIRQQKAEAYPIQCKIPSNMIPIQLPKTNDQWRGNTVGATLYGDRVIGLGVAAEISNKDVDSENEEHGRDIEQIRFNKLIEKQKRTKHMRYNSNQISSKLLKLDMLKSPLRSIQTKQFNIGEQDIELVINSSQAHPNIYQTQVGLRLGLDSLKFGGGRSFKPNLNEAKRDLLKLKTQIDEIISSVHQIDQEPNEKMQQQRKKTKLESHEQQREEQRSQISTESVLKQKIFLTECLDQDREPQVQKSCMQTQTTMQQLKSTLVQTEKPQLKSISHNMKIQTDFTSNNKETASIGTQYQSNSNLGPQIINKVTELVPKEDFILNEKALTRPTEPNNIDIQLENEFSPALKTFPFIRPITPPEQTQRGLLQIFTNAKSQSQPPVHQEQKNKDPDISKMIKRQTALAIRREIRRGEITLKELINKLYELESNYMMKDYAQSLQQQFYLAIAQAPKRILDEETGQQCISMDDFIKFMLQKKIKVTRDKITDICQGESDVQAIKFVSFIKLLLLASCGGDKQKLGTRNFKKLIKHMEVT